jgi:hypothetical protein
MYQFTPTITDQYRRYVDLLRRHHHLLCERASDEVLEPIEDEMTQLWGGLDAAQQRSLSGLSSDLNWLARDGRSTPKGRSAEGVTADELRELSEARDRNDWHAVLHYLRLCAAKVPSFDVATLRTTAWQAVGFPQVSELFGAFAARLERKKAGSGVMAHPLDAPASLGDRAATTD